MKKVKQKGWIIFSGLMLCTPLWAKEGVTFSSGYGTARIIPLRIGIQTEFAKRWRTESSWPIGGYWEGSLYRMHGKKGNQIGSHEKLYAGVVAGAIRFERAERISLGWPYVEVGIGVSWVSQKEIGGRDLGIHFQFEDKLGIGIRFGEKRQYDISYKAIHFSNAYLGSTNHGLNLQLLTLGYWF